MQQVQPVIILLDDDESVLRSLKRLFLLAGYAVTAYSRAGEFLENMPLDGEGCLVMDLRMPNMSGLEVQQAAHAKGCTMPFVFISGHGEVPAVVQAMKAGATDFLEKPVLPEVLMKAVEKALASGRIGNRKRRIENDAQDRVGKLSPREREVCELVAQGLLNKQIATALGTSEKTVKAQRGNAIKKIRAGSTAELLNLLYLAGRPRIGG